jgi:prepilin-type N-terminal cleavage/methylation domain-containing protein
MLSTVSESNSMRRRRGFTLLEVLTAVILIALGSAGIGTMISTTSTSATRVRTAADELRSTLDSARHLALARNHMTEVRVTAAENPAWVSSAWGTVPASPTVPISVPFVLPQGITLQGWPGIVQFDASGRADRSLDLRITADGRNIRLRFFQASGVLTLQAL